MIAASMIGITPPTSAEVRDDGLSLHPPTAWPRALPPSSKATPVTFRALVTGTSKPPNVLCLDKMTKDGAVLKQGVAVLLDNGVGGTDSLAGDRFYAGTLDIGSPRETEEFYRLWAPVPGGGPDAGGQGDKRFCAEYGGRKVTSAPIMFPITNLPMPPHRIPRGALVKGPTSPYRFFSGELLVGAVPGTSPRTMREAVQKVSMSPDASGAKIVEFIPSFDLYVVEVDGGGSTDAVQRAIKAFLARPEVRSASPNFEVVAASAGISPTNPAYTTVPPDLQWYLKGKSATSEGMYADGAWAANASGCGSIQVAVVDEGIHEGHQDLTGQFAGPIPNTPQIRCGKGTTAIHGTLVAGVIAANVAPPSTTSTMVGVAPNTKILNCAGTLSSSSALGTIQEAKNAGEVKVFNFSWTTGFSNDLKNAICTVICHKRLVVAAAGNEDPVFLDPVTDQPVPSRNCEPTQRYPAAFNQPGQTCTCPDGSTVAMASGVLAVGALDKEGYVAWGMDTQDNLTCSNFGNSVELYAPGKNIYTTTTPNAHVTIGGTTLSTAMVSGAAAVVWAAHPSWDYAKVEERLRNSAKSLDLTLPEYTNHPYFKNHPTELATQLTGKRLHLGDAAVNTPSVLNAPNQEIHPDQTLKLTFTATDPDNDKLIFQIPANLPVFATNFRDNGGGIATLDLAPKARDLGTHKITLVVTDDACPVGGSYTKTMTINVTAPPVSLPSPSNLRVQ